MTLHWLVPIRHQSVIRLLSQQVPSVFLTAPHNTQVKIHPVSKLNSLHLLPFAHVGFIQLHDQPVLLVVASVFKETTNGCSQSAYKFSMDIRQKISITPWNRLPWTEEGWPLHHYCWSQSLLSPPRCRNSVYWMEIQSCLIAAPVYLPWVPASSWWFKVQKVPGSKLQHALFIC